METNKFYYRHIQPADTAIIAKFTLANDSGGFLAEYLHELAINDEMDNRMRTYLVFTRDSNELVAYFSLKAGFVAAGEKGAFFWREFDSSPGVELANFAVNGEYKKAHPIVKHIGAYVFSECILPVVYEAARYIGIDILYIFSLPYESLINYYGTLGFSRLTHKQEWMNHRRIRLRYDGGCIFMYQQL